MLRTLFSILLTLVLLAAPAALHAQEIGPGAERGPDIDPNGLTTTGGTPDGATTTSCLLESCGERGPASDPDGLTAGPAAAGPFAPFLEWLRGLLAS